MKIAAAIMPAAQITALPVVVIVKLPCNYGKHPCHIRRGIVKDAFHCAAGKPCSKVCFINLHVTPGCWTPIRRHGHAANHHRTTTTTRTTIGAAARG
ncbi:MAG: hypothetical protein HC794_10490 [Nitrospiraceae bacterium]|nr:hypothetical protein [Nitrospiraceae bacterium]